MKIILFLFLIFIHFTPAQQIKFGVFTSGAGVSSNTGFSANSNIGQNFIGLSSNSGFVLGSGFFYGVNLILSVDKEEGLPTEFNLEQNYPNPFNPSTTIKFSIPNPEHVVLKIYDVVGSEVATLVNQQMDAGNYSLTFDASQLASGVYIYRISAGSFISIKKMMLVK
jgi:hypothetical protein